MSQSIVEYYDLFDVAYKLSDKTRGVTIPYDNDPLPDDIASTSETNTFRGFNSFSTKDAWSSIQEYVPPPNEPSQYEVITGQHKAPQAITNIEVRDNGDIYCYPPNVSVPYWNRVIFRHYDYTIKPQTNALQNFFRIFNNEFTNDIFVPYKPDRETPPSYSPDTSDLASIKSVETGSVNYNNVPLFVKCDEYPSRSKVIFSKGDINKEADIVLKFGYHKGQMEPIKLNLSLSCNNYINDGTYLYNNNLTLDDMLIMLAKCNFSIEWVYDRDSGN